ncbi:MAG: 2-hydroxychromene-2-carboxylate isomerase [Pseudomonadota bacterium]
MASAPNDRTIDYYLTVESPWSYLGHLRLKEIAAEAGATISLKPCDYGAIFKVSGGLPLKKRPPQRQAYRLIELDRWSVHLDVPIIRTPKHFPVSADLANRVVIAAQRLHQDAFGLTLALMQGVWIEEQDIADPHTIGEIALTCGMEGEALLEEADKPETAALFEANTNEAIGRQVFGAPTYVLDGELFWGQDRLDFLERALATDAT